MNAPSTKIENNKLIIEGDFEFTIGPSIYQPETHRPIKEISFGWSPESPMDTSCLQKGEFEEFLAKKLKQDFLKMLKGDVKPTILTKFRP